jgi:hypothetical protein
MAKLIGLSRLGKLQRAAAVMTFFFSVVVCFDRCSMAWRKLFGSNHCPVSSDHLQLSPVYCASGSTADAALAVIDCRVRLPVTLRLFGLSLVSYTLTQVCDQRTPLAY